MAVALGWDDSVGPGDEVAGAVVDVDELVLGGALREHRLHAPEYLSNDPALRGLVVLTAPYNASNLANAGSHRQGPSGC